MNLLTKTKTET